MRIDKYLSECSQFSRKELRDIIRKGRVTVNGSVVRDFAMHIDTDAQVAIDGVVARYRKYIYLMLNKPAGFLSATEDDRDPVVTELVPKELRHFNVFPAGRLDKDTEGLLILTNDGQFDHNLTAPRKDVCKRYFARLDAPASPEDAAVFAEPMDLGDFTAKPGRLHLTDVPDEVYIDIAEGKFHQVKRMCEKVGKRVIFLKRVAIGGLVLDASLAAGKVRELDEAELSAALAPGFDALPEL